MGSCTNENVRISISISLKFVPEGPINNIPALVQIMAWRRPGHKPLSGCYSLIHHRHSFEDKLTVYFICGCWILKSLQWRHNDHDGVSNHQPHGCLLNRLFRRRSKKTSKLRVTGLCVGNSPGPHKGSVTRKMFPFEDVIMWVAEIWLQDNAQSCWWFVRPGKSHNEFTH